MARILAGSLSILTSDGGNGAIAAQADFQRAAALVPYSADARNLALISRIYLAYEGLSPGMRARELADDLVQVASLEPGNAQLLGNVASLYKVLNEPGPPPGADVKFNIAESDLTARVKLVEEVLGGRRSP